MSQGTGYDPKDRQAERRVQIWIAIIAALSGIVIAAIGLIGTLRATDREIVSSSATSVPTVTVGTPGPTVTITVIADPSGGSDGGSSAEPPAGDAIHINWEDPLYDRDGAEVGNTMKFQCPRGGIAQPVYGDGLYESQSSICTAAVHDGRITLKNGGVVTLMVREGAEKYPAVHRHGITSKSTESGVGSFEFLPPR